MTKSILTLALATLALCGCSSSKSANEISWQAFCLHYGYSIDDHSEQAVNDYLDAWCGSALEEDALIAAGIQVI